MRLPVILAALLMSSAAAGAQDCAPTHPELAFETVTPGVLTQAVAIYMPYSAVDASGEPIGVDGYLLKEIAKRTCLKITAIPVDSAAAMNYVIGGRADLTTGGYYRTAQRAKVVNLSDPLYLDQMGIVSKEGWSSFDQLKGKSVGTVQGDLWVADLKKMFGDDLKLYSAQPQLQQDMEAGRLDAIITGYSVAITAQNEGQLTEYKAAVAEPDEAIGASVDAGQGSFPMRKQNTPMLAAFNAIIADMRADGTIAAALEAYGLDASAAEAGEPRLLN